jgi:Zn-dependent protease
VKNTQSRNIGLYAGAAKVGGKATPALLKLAKALKAGKVILVGATAASYALIFTWQFALIIMAALVIHEYGHVWAMKRLGMKTKGIYFIPLFGAISVGEKAFIDRWTQAATAFAGPLTGGLLAGVGALAFVATGNPYVAAVAGWIAFFNLFNLLPITPLDGGHILKSIVLSTTSRAVLIVFASGLLVTIALAAWVKFYLFAILAPIALVELLHERHKTNKAKEISPYYATVHFHAKQAMSPRAARYAFIGYVVLAVSLWALMLVLSHQPGADAALKTMKG